MELSRKTRNYLGMVDFKKYVKYSKTKFGNHDKAWPSRKYLKNGHFLINFHQLFLTSH